MTVASDDVRQRRPGVARADAVAENIADREDARRRC